MMRFKGWIIGMGVWLSVGLVVPLTAGDTSTLLRDKTIAAEATPDKINLALRRTADKLLRAMKDSTSRIPAVEKVNDHVWRLHLDQPFPYDQLPAILQASLDQYGIDQAYEVTIRQCESSIIDLGYHQQDFLQDSTVPCGGREAPQGCHYIEVAFQDNAETKSIWWAGGGMLLLIAGGLLLFRKDNSSAASPSTTGENDWLTFGQSRLQMTGQLLESSGIRHTLTFREAKLLRLFASRLGQLLDRDEILNQVWGDEGVQVGRSVDVFVSRLRKKLATDSSISIVAVHGVGYRMEIRM